MTGQGVAAGGDPKVIRPGLVGRIRRLALRLEVRLSTSRQAGDLSEELQRTLCDGDFPSAWRQPGLERARIVDAHERSVTRLEQEIRLNQREKKRLTRLAVEPPEAPRLRFRQAQSRHFEKLALHSPEHVIVCPCRHGRHHWFPPLPVMVGLLRPSFLAMGVPADRARMANRLPPDESENGPFLDWRQLWCTRNPRDGSRRCSNPDNACTNSHQVPRADHLSPSLHLPAA